MEQDLKITEGELWTKGNKISFVGTAREAKERLKNEMSGWDRQIDGCGNLLMPGFKNAHTHSAMTFLRSFADDLPLKAWLFDSVFPREAKLTGEDVYYFSKLAIMEYLTSGITSNFDMYMHIDDGAQAAIDSGFRTVLCGSINDFGGTAENLNREYRHFNNMHERISYQLGFHAEYTTAKPLLLDIVKLAEELKAPVYTHNSETKEEVAGCIERYQTTPTVFLDSIGMFQYGGGGFHCVHMTEEDLRVMKDRGLYAVTNPASNAKLASGIAPLEEMLQMGIPIAIGTDGAASNNSLDMFKEMFMAVSLQKIKNEDAASLDANEVLKMACVNSATAMGLTDCDCLQEGKLADLIMINMHRPNMQPEHNLTKNIVYSASKENVKMTMVNGKILYEDGEFRIGEDAEDIYRKISTIMKSDRFKV